jgi:hypothetical protein
MGELLSKESEDRDQGQLAGLDSLKDIDRPYSVFARFSSWLGKQSLTRLLGLLVGNTRDLELRLVDKNGEITWLRTQLINSQSQLQAFQDSILTSKGMLSTSPLATKSNNNQGQTINYAPGEKLAIENEVDKLRELLIYKPDEIEEAVADLLATNTPRNKEIVRKFYIWIETMPDSNDGVIIQG